MKARSNQPHKVEASEEKRKGAAIRYVSSPSLCYNKVCGAERARSAPPTALPVEERGWLIALHQNLSSWAVIDCGRIEEKEEWEYTMGSLNIGQTPQSDKPIRTLHLHSLAVTPSHFAAKMCDLSD